MRPMLIATLIVLGGCANSPGEVIPQFAGIDGEACVGELPQAIAGLERTTNNSLLRKAQRRSSEGGMCLAAVYQVQSPVTLFRVYRDSPTAREPGVWWSMTLPQESLDEFRRDNGICPEWGAKDRLIRCEVVSGSLIVVGTTQSQSCENGLQLPKSATLQVFVPNDDRKRIVHTGSCTIQAITDP